jgi:hypothetical protein
MVTPHTLRHSFAAHLLSAGRQSARSDRSGWATPTSARPRCIARWSENDAELVRTDAGQDEGRGTETHHRVGGSLQDPGQKPEITWGQGMQIDLSGSHRHCHRSQPQGRDRLRHGPHSGRKQAPTFFSPTFYRTMATQPWGSKPQEVEERCWRSFTQWVCARMGWRRIWRKLQTPRRMFEAVEGLMGAPSILVNNATHSEKGDIWRVGCGAT